MAESGVILETSVLVDYLRGHPPALQWMRDLPAEASITFVTAAELLAGCRNRREQRLIEQELRNYEVLWGSVKSSATALAWFRQYHLSHGVGFLDCLIGAIAEEAGAPLYTLNESHFSPLPGLVTRRPY